MTISCGDSGETVVGRGNVALAVIGCPPCGYGAVVSQAKAVVHSPRDCDETAVGRGDVALAVAVTSPRDYGAIRPQAEAVIISRRDCGETAVGRGDVALTVFVPPPCGYGAVVPQAEAVIPSRRNCCETAVGRGNVALAVVVLPPHDYAVPENDDLLVAPDGQAGGIGGTQGVVGGGLCEGGIVEGKHAWIGEYAELLRREGVSGYPGDVGTVEGVAEKVRIRAPGP
ncbi:MAG: hypothetical protein BWY06_03326 [Candidatus Latescibacteria bacterium ADurb.Bin168]|nr:MAG: hypothetical protein BWY06_03326 [Candidatus Latescibacteria bacterium ADurb.Bin168]